ncbi:hypothetical protein ABZY14_33895 [Streptomyces sp. NPDC006617]|uniref:hypothetical protein n=1 Tax=Streptomyces sp. NPDC006617 TaxID=3155354 RepID=UPI0033AD27A9
MRVLSWFPISTVYALGSRIARPTACLEKEPAADDTRLRHRLMTVGHDPLKP